MHPLPHDKESGPFGSCKRHIIVITSPMNESTISTTCQHCPRESYVTKLISRNRIRTYRVLLRAGATGAAAPVNFGLRVHAPVNFSAGCSRSLI